MNSAVRIFTFDELAANGTGGATIYPLGVNTVNGVYAADHATTSDTNSTSSNDNTTPLLPPPAENSQTYTVSAAPVQPKCTCPACMGLSRIAQQRRGNGPVRLGRPRRVIKRVVSEARWSCVSKTPHPRRDDRRSAGLRRPLPSGEG